MRVPLQTEGFNRMPSTSPASNNIAATQFQNLSLTRRAIPPFIPLPSGGVIGVTPRPCADCDLLFLACRAAGLPDATCLADDRECRITCN